VIIDEVLPDPLRLQPDSELASDSLTIDLAPAHPPTPATVRTPRRPGGRNGTL
jgi:hypothetical protein